MGSKPTICVYLSSHGYGHCRRTGAVLSALARRREVRIEVMGSAPQTLWPAELRSTTVAWRAEPCDVGVVQPDDLSVDREATAAALSSWREDYEDLVAREAERLRGGAALIVGDVPPLAFDAAAAAGIPAVAIANFSWDWIYSEMGFDDAARSATRAYATAAVLVELTPFAPMSAFVRRLSVGVVGTASSLGRAAARRILGLRDDQRLVLVAMRGDAGELVGLPPATPAIRYLWPSAHAVRKDVIEAPAQLSFSDLIVAADVVVAKPGYGIIGDAAVAGTPLLYVEREGFPEDAVLLRWLAGSDAAARTTAESLAGGRWLVELERLLELERSQPSATNGVEAAAGLLDDALGR